MTVRALPVSSAAVGTRLAVTETGGSVVMVGESAKADVGIADTGRARLPRRAAKDAVR
ncbi:hypothetical protein GCM10022293_14230 [Azospirillum formosense]